MPWRHVILVGSWLRLQNLGPVYTASGQKRMRRKRAIPLNFGQERVTLNSMQMVGRIENQLTAAWCRPVIARFRPARF